jgi:ribosomal protein L11 methyltransferase
MGFRQFKFNSHSEELLALLSLFPFEAFEEKETEILGYIEETQCSESFYHDLEVLCKSKNVSFTQIEIEDINWNAEWESSFTPVVVGDFCSIRASFHPTDFNTKHIITIDPKMAFGTGHHETTFMMISLMEGMDFYKKSVLDHGCGTGVLAILAEKCGAEYIDAIDIEEDSFTNTQENAQLNHCSHINPILGTISDAMKNEYDIIIANINRNVLLQTVDQHADLLRKKGILCLSGILATDKNLILMRYTEKGFQLLEEIGKGNWIALKLTI